ncbi:MAG TPA: hypothetical protein PLU10_04175 [Chitinophagaceae bacterium]|nr:hypothetical protein [Chitinophagaceae bacterium]
MKKLATTLLSIILMITIVHAQKDCKPDIDKMDKINKTAIKLWEIKLGEMGFGSNIGAKILGKDSKEWTAYLRFIRDKNQNYITFMVTQTFAESESANISKFFGGTDLDLSLAFDGDLPPVKFQSQIPQHTQTKLLGLVRHEVHLSQVLNEEKFNDKR